MYHDTVEPIELLHYAYLNVRIFYIDFPPKTLVMCPKLNHVYFHGWLVPSKCIIFISEIHAFFGFDHVVVPLIYSFSITNNEHHQKLRTIALVIR
jgi:hypothetical protein